MSPPENADVVVVGFGWAGQLIAHELVANGYDVVALERGEDAGELPSCGHFHGFREGRRRKSRSARLPEGTFTVRYRDGVTYPVRRGGPFLPGRGVGGAGMLWAGLSPRYRPESFAPSVALAEQLERTPFAARTDLHDWAVTYAELEPWYCRFEQIAGVSGGPGSSGPRSAPYPVAPGLANEGPTMFRDGAAALGYRPAPLPVSELDVAYTNPLGARREPCDEFGTTLATPVNTVLGAALSSGHLRLITGAEVTRLVHRHGKVREARYVHAGRERFVRAERFVLASWALNNVRLLLLSGIGEPYDPRTRRGVVGRALSNHLTLGATAFFDREIDTSRRTGAGWAIADLENGTGTGGFVGGAQLHSSSLELKPQPTATVPPGTPRWGAAWKEALRAAARKTLRVNITCEVVPAYERFADLDPVYRDVHGDPLLRLTFDWTENERAQARAYTAIGREILAATGARMVRTTEDIGAHYRLDRYQNTHLAGGAVLGKDPRSSVVDPCLRAWDARNLWVVGASAFPRNPSANPTATVGALALRAGESIVRSLRTASPAAAHHQPDGVRP